MHSYHTIITLPANTKLSEDGNNASRTKIAEILQDTKKNRGTLEFYDDFEDAWEEALSLELEEKDSALIVSLKSENPTYPINAININHVYRFKDSVVIKSGNTYERSINEWKQKYKIPLADLSNKIEIINIPLQSTERINILSQSQETIIQIFNIMDISDKEIYKILRIAKRDVDLGIKKLIEDISKTKNNLSLNILMVKIEKLNMLRFKKFKFNNYSSEMFNQLLKPCIAFYKATSFKRKFKDYAPATTCCCASFFSAPSICTCALGCTAMFILGYIAYMYKPFLLNGDQDSWGQSLLLFSYYFLGSATSALGMFASGLFWRSGRRSFRKILSINRNRTSNQQNLKQKICLEISKHWNSIDECLQSLKEVIGKQIKISESIKNILKLIQSYSSQNQSETLDNMIEKTENICNNYDDMSIVDLNILHNEFKELESQFANESSSLLEDNFSQLMLSI